MPDEQRTTIWASLGATINTGNFQNQKIDIGISGIPVDCTPDELQERLDKAQTTIYKTVEFLAEQMIQRMKDYGK